MEDTMSGACGTYGKDEKCVFDSKYLKGRGNFGNVSICGRIILKSILWKSSVTTGFF
jgi:hypothetical protein